MRMVCRPIAAHVVPKVLESCEEVGSIVVECRTGNLGPRTHVGPNVGGTWESLGNHREPFGNPEQDEPRRRGWSLGLQNHHKNCHTIDFCMFFGPCAVIDFILYNSEINDLEQIQEHGKTQFVTGFTIALCIL